MLDFVIFKPLENISKGFSLSIYKYLTGYHKLRFGFLNLTIRNGTKMRGISPAAHGPVGPPAGVWVGSWAGVVGDTGVFVGKSGFEGIGVGVTSTGCAGALLGITSYTSPLESAIPCSPHATASASSG